MDYDVFISHASEDKADVARPLAAHLQHLGLKIWLDELELTLGDSLRRSIDRGLSLSRYGVVILSPAFFVKEWPNRELDGLVARESGRDKVILPVWHNIGADEIIRYSPTLADKMAVSTSRGLEQVAREIFNAAQHKEDGDVTAISGLTPSEHEILESLRLRMLSADSSWELRKILYESEEYLAKYPHSPGARLFKDNVSAAMRRAEEMEQPAAYDRAPPASMAPPSRRVSIIDWLIRIAAAAGAGYILYLLFRLFL